jgi:hypothetical protein
MHCSCATNHIVVRAMPASNVGSSERGSLSEREDESCADAAYLMRPHLEPVKLVALPDVSIASTQSGDKKP